MSAPSRAPGTTRFNRDALRGLRSPWFTGLFETRRLGKLLGVRGQARLDPVIERFGDRRGYLYFCALGGNLLARGLARAVLQVLVAGSSPFLIIFHSVSTSVVPDWMTWLSRVGSGSTRSVLPPVTPSTLNAQIPCWSR
jgi:hypothetical protein